MPILAIDNLKYEDGRLPQLSDLDKRYTRIYVGSEGTFEKTKSESGEPT